MNQMFPRLRRNDCRTPSSFFLLTRPIRYSAAKQYLITSAGLKDDAKTHAAASLAAGTMATTICAPADVLKSRLQSSAGKEVSIHSSLRTSLLTYVRVSYKYSVPACGTRGRSSYSEGGRQHGSD